MNGATFRDSNGLWENYDVSQVAITQNVDDLHERAGSAKIIHLHGEITKACNENKNQVIEIGYNDIGLGDKAADGSQLRPFIAWFGESVPMMEQAIKIVQSADILLIVGTSLQVYPAASLVRLAPITTPIYLIDPQPVNNENEIIVIRKKASQGMEDFRDFLLTGKELPRPPC